MSHMSLSAARLSVLVSGVSSSRRQFLYVTYVWHSPISLTPPQQFFGTLLSFVSAISFTPLAVSCVDCNVSQAWSADTLSPDHHSHDPMAMGLRRLPQRLNHQKAHLVLPRSDDPHWSLVCSAGLKCVSASLADCRIPSLAAKWLLVHTLLFKTSSTSMRPAQCPRPSAVPTSKQSMQANVPLLRLTATFSALIHHSIENLLVHVFCYIDDTRSVPDVQGRGLAVHAINVFIYNEIMPLSYHYSTLAIFCSSRPYFAKSTAKLPAPLQLCLRL